MAATLRRFPAPTDAVRPEFRRRPSNIPAEQAILGAALVNGAAIAACGFLRPEDFFEPAHGRIWTVVLGHVAAGRRADPVTLGPLFDEDPGLKAMGGRAYLADLAGRAESILNARDYALVVRAEARKRRLADAALALAERCEHDMEAGATEILAAGLGALEAEGLDDARPAGRTLRELASDIADDLLNPPETFATGVGPLDRGIGGVIPYGYLLGFEARPAGFKTGVLHTVALNVAMTGVPCCYLAAEMGGKRLAQRMLGHLGGFESQWFRHRDGRIVSALSRIAPRLPASLVVEDCAGLTFGRLKHLASEQLVRRKCRVFFLDYYQLVAPDGKVDNRSQHLEEVAYWLQGFAYKHGVTWFIASQQNRDGLSLGGDGLLRACDWLCRINKLEDKVDHPDRGDVEAVWLDVAKARDGTGEPVGTEERPMLYIDPHGPHLAEIVR